MEEGAWDSWLGGLRAATFIAPSAPSPEWSGKDAPPTPPPTCQVHPTARGRVGLQDVWFLPPAATWGMLRLRIPDLSWKRTILASGYTGPGAFLCDGDSPGRIPSLPGAGLRSLPEKPLRKMEIEWRSCLFIHCKNRAVKGEL